MSVFRVYSEKKADFAVEAKSIMNDLKENLFIEGLSNVRLLNRYDVEGIERELFDKALPIIFSEPPVDDVYFSLPKNSDFMFATEFLPGQFDQRADSCEQCVALLEPGAVCKVRSAKVYLLYGTFTDEEKAKIKNYLINPVEAREASFDEFETLKEEYDIPTEVETLDGFKNFNALEKADFLKKMGLAMDADDLDFCQAYFRDVERRDPTITEIKMIDTYWSDHCRHTTFLTNIDGVEIKSGEIENTYNMYMDLRSEVYGERISKKPVCLMDIATLGAKALKKKGLMPDLDESEEINACSVKIKVNTDDGLEDWLLMFKNETHNHPTEIEPFGGAATCLGGAIRDPLSGRAYVYQAMRVTGASDPRKPVSETLEGKLPQKKLVNTAAAGYSSYGNQIGLATGLVDEIYHDGYTAKRMEIGAVMAAAPIENVVRERPEDGDIIIILGGRTGRDGCGGATGSSKSHTLDSITTCGAEVQKGNPPTERKIQRLFRNPDVTKLIKRCNDFGAGGVSVAIGELADGLIINLDAVPKKYDGLDGTELAISESQERMAVVVAPENADKFIELAYGENLEATRVAVVTEEARLKMNWNGKTIVNISRDFLNSNGAVKVTDVSVPDYDFCFENEGFKGDKDAWISVLSDLNVCSKKGLSERFDSTIGAGSVLMPFGGKYQLTPTQLMAAHIPVLGKSTDTASVMAYGFDPYLSSKNPYLGAYSAIIESVARLAAAGADLNKMWLTLQEYFPRTKNDAARWGLPFSALLGALKAQLDLGIGAIGGKDSMSGTFENIDVPPTLVSFAVSVINSNYIVSNEFKKAGSKVYLLKPAYKANGMIDAESFKALCASVRELIKQKKIYSSFALGYKGVASALPKMCFGNMIGFEFDNDFDISSAANDLFGCFIVETDEFIDGILLGKTTESGFIKSAKGEISLDDAVNAWTGTLESVFPTMKGSSDEMVPTISCFNGYGDRHVALKNKPKVVIPVFPGTNCEYDSAKRFTMAGAECETVLIGNLNEAQLKDSIERMSSAIASSQIIMFPGGFSGGDEPEGSGKFIASFFRNEQLKNNIHEFLNKRNGLVLGICNGFQALIKLGLLPYGEIKDMTEDSPTLTFNTIGRHQSMIVRTRVATNASPWLSKVKVGDIYNVAISHGEGRFIANKTSLIGLSDNGQVATQYVDLEGNPTMKMPFNPNASLMAIEGIISPDGKVFGKMGHVERSGENIFKNVPGEYDMHIFEAGVEYFK
ncbi:MAG: phosphoribosylformylglycinamidine synthase [Clostridia bacterium]|nr:phosphoribosylformylglycinamidine synthase [Clostridia bacterium]